MFLVCVISISELIDEFLNNQILPLDDPLQLHNASIHFLKSLNLCGFYPLNF
jgi:hypothetical protein